MAAMKTSPSLYQEMTDYLETMIAGGVFRPGERLMPLRELGNRFGVSPSTVRRGIEYLCEKGLLEMRHGSGTYVVEKRSVPENGERSVAVFIISDDLARQLLRPRAAGRAAGGGAAQVAAAALFLHLRGGRGSGFHRAPPVGVAV